VGDNASDQKHEAHLPEVIGRYFSAHDRRDSDAALATFAPDAVVIDDGREYAVPDEIRDWLAHASTQFTYTRTFTGAEAVGLDTWLVTNRLEGNFPGGIVDLTYRFRMAGDLIAELVISP
jgi:ketosteroid isomerase-like protein